MSKIFMTKKKTATATIAVLAAAALLLGGTFAWQSISQTALNEVKSTVNPGGRLHDDFVEITAEGYDVMTYDKDVYVENFTSLTNNGVQVYARVRFDEYMEIGTNAGSEDASEATSLIPGANLADKTTWTTYKYDEDSDFRDYFAIDFEGTTVYMPTFNKDMNSLDADINGTFANNFEDYTKYEAGEEVTADATYAGETDAEGNQTMVTVEETHIAKETLESTIISMEAYLEKLENDGDFDGTGDFWVYDTDGWAYWANPIDPDTATGLLLDGINRTEQIINDDWYYAINVVAQFVTYDDLGQEDNTGFYDTSDGSTVPTANALDLLNRIGVKVTYTVATAEEFANALANGGTVILANNITLDTQVEVNKNTVLDLGDYEITVEDPFYDVDAQLNSLISVRGATLTINGGKFTALENDSFCVDVREGGKVIINGGTFLGNISAVYVVDGEAVIYGGDFDVQQLADVGEVDKRFMLNCCDENYEAGTAKITVCGGTYHGFDPSACSEVTIPSNYKVTSSNVGEEVVYTVVK